MSTPATQLAMVRLIRLLVTDIQQIGLQFNLGILESLNLKPDGTCEALFPSARILYAWDGTVIKVYARTPEPQKPAS